MCNGDRLEINEENNLVSVGPWQCYTRHNPEIVRAENLAVLESSIVPSISLEGILNRPRIKSITGIALTRDWREDKAIEHVYVFRDDGSPQALEISVDKFVKSILPADAVASKLDKYRNFMLAEIRREDELRAEARAAAHFEIQLRREGLNTHDGKSLPIYIGIGELRSSITDGDWIETSIHVLDMTDYYDFKELFQLNEVSGFRAEHMLEHLSLAEAFVGLQNVHSFLKPGGSLRVAVPDYNAIRLRVEASTGVDPDVYLVEKDRDEGHKVRYTPESLTLLLQQAGFSRVEVIEYTDGEGHLVSQPDWDKSLGYIKRSSRGGVTSGAVSIIVDAFKSDSTSSS